MNKLLSTKVNANAILLLVRRCNFICFASRKDGRLKENTSQTVDKKKYAKDTQ